MADENLAQASGSGVSGKDLRQEELKLKFEVIKAGLVDEKNPKRMRISMFRAQYYANRELLPPKMMNILKKAEKKFKEVKQDGSIPRKLFSVDYLKEIADTLLCLHNDYENGVELVKNPFFPEQDQGKKIIEIFPEWKAILAGGCNDFLECEEALFKEVFHHLRPDLANQRLREVSFIVDKEYECEFSDENRIFYNRLMTDLEEKVNLKNSEKSKNQTIKVKQNGG